MNLLTGIYDKRETRYWGHWALLLNVSSNGLNFAIGSSFPTEEEPTSSFDWRDLTQE